MSKKEELLFVYNADSGFLNAAMDSVFKFFSPDYACELCSITHGSFGMKKKWSIFFQSLEIPVWFLHKDEWLKEFKNETELPAVLLRKEETIEIIVHSKEMKNLESRQLMNIIKKRVVT